MKNLKKVKNPKSFEPGIGNFGDTPLDLPGDPYHEDEGFPPLPEEKLKISKRKYIKKIK